MTGVLKMRNILFVAILGVLFLGCRREDIREFELVIDDLSQERKAQVQSALSRFAGIDESSYVFDFDKKTLFLKYDSMQLAKENIRQALEEKGLKVKRD
jgi:hypothetical protein